MLITRANPSSAVLEAAYGATRGSPMVLLRDPMKTWEPGRPDSIWCQATAVERKNGASMFTAWSRLQSSIVTSMATLRICFPAAWMTPSMGLSATILSTRGWMLSGCARSATSVWHVPPVASHRAAVDASWSSLRATIVISAPHRLADRAMACPRPRPPPVTTAKALIRGGATVTAAAEAVSVSRSSLYRGLARTVKSLPSVGSD